MEYTISISIDKYPDGAPRRTRTGEYRMSLVIKSTDGADTITLRGYRVNSDFKRLMPPTTVYFNKRLHLVTMTPALQQRILDAAKSDVQPET